MATAKKPSAKKPAAKKPPELVFDDGYWWIVTGGKRVNAGRSKTYAAKMLESQR